MEIDKQQWHSEVYKILLGDYMLDPIEADLDQLSSAYASGYTPKEFVEWFAAKYDLDKKE